MKFWKVAATAATAAAVAMLCLEAGAQTQAPTQTVEKAKSRKSSKRGAAAQPAPTPPAPPPAEAPALPKVEPLSVAIQPYAAFQNDISELQGRSIGSAADLDQILDRASGQNRDALTRGLIAYGALTAAQSPEFAQGVRQTASFYGQAAMIRGLTLDPAYARTLDGGAKAAQIALDTIRADGDRVFSVGERYKEMAYSIQRQRWAAAVAPAQPARLSRLRNLAAGASGRSVPSDLAPRLAPAAASLTPWADPNQFGGRNFWNALRAPAPTATVDIASAQPAMAPPTVRAHPDRLSTINNATTLAAIYVLGATAAPEAQAERLLNDRGSQRCFEMAQVQFYQCMSAARFHYENSFCLGEHALKDMGRCISNATQPQ